MTSVNSLQDATSKAQVQQSVQPPKTLQTQPVTQNLAPQDVVTISQQAREALASNTKTPSGADANTNGYNH